MNDFLNAEQRLRLKCVYLHSTSHTVQDREMSQAEVAFVLGVSKQYIQQIEENALQKLKRRKCRFFQFLKELEQ